MKRFILWTGAAGVLIGSWTLWHFSSFRWAPLASQRIPPPNGTATFHFWAARGTFRIWVNMPMSITRVGIGEPAAMPDLPPIVCRLKVITRRGRQRIGSFEVTSIRHVGEYGYGHVDLFDAGDILLPKLGRYELTISNLDPKSPVSAGTFDLERHENTEDAAFASAFSLLVTLVLLGLSFLCAAYQYFRKFRRTPSRVRTNFLHFCADSFRDCEHEQGK